jgi:tetratricopeptide (TPR) repeat protein
MSQARAFEKRGDIQNAARTYQSILESHPGNARARRALEKLNTAEPSTQSQAPDAGLAELFSGAGSGQAADVVKRALSQQARFAKSALYWLLLADAQKRLRQLDAALGSFRKAIRLSPDHAPAHYNLANTLFDLKRYDEAGSVYKRAFALETPSAHALNNMGVIEAYQHQYALSVETFRQAIRINPDLSQAHFNLGASLYELGLWSDAIGSLERVVRLVPQHHRAFKLIGDAHLKMGRFEAAEAAFRKAISANPDFVDAYRSLGLLRAYERDDPMLGRLEPMQERQDLSLDSRCQLHFTLAKAYDDQGKDELAFDHYAKGNATRRAITNYDIKKDQALFAALTAAAMPLKALTPPAIDETLKPTPVFILGMPRSGTTLIEHILSSHSEVSDGGELPYALKFGLQLARGETPASPDALLDFQSKYLKALGGHDQGGLTYVTDKTPHNFLLTALILSALPHARIIHTRRKAEAVCWSNFTRYFTSQHTDYSNSLEDTVAYYRLYQTFMEQMNALFPGRIHEVDYDQLTETPEDMTRQMLDRIGLSWEPACLAPEKNRRSVATASFRQVRAPIYKGSSQAWRRFEPFIGDAFQRLRD